MRMILGCAVVLWAAACTSASASRPQPLHPLNEALVQYLGEPVAMPDSMDAAYSSEGMQTAFRSACEAMGVTVRMLIADDSEFPVVLGGVLESNAGPPDLEALVTAADSEKYRFSGGRTSGSSTNGVHSTTFSINIVPGHAFPVHALMRIEKRLTLRGHRLFSRLR